MEGLLTLPKWGDRPGIGCIQLTVGSGSNVVIVPCFLLAAGRSAEGTTASGRTLVCKAAAKLRG